MQGVHFTHAHHLRNLAEPLAEADSAFKVELRKAVRQEVGALIRAEKPTETPQSNVLTMTGLLPDDPPATAEPESPEPASSVAPASDATLADEVVTHLLRHTRYPLTLKGRPPFRSAGIETYQRLQGVIVLTDELLDHRYDPHMARLNQGLQVALLPFAGEYRDLQRGATWLQEISRILEPPDDNPTSGERVSQQLRTYLDGLLNLSDVSPRLDAFRHHLDKVSTSYWPGLFHCYDLEGLPRTNNDVESLFRDTQRRLLRTTGQHLRVHPLLLRGGGQPAFGGPLGLRFWRCPSATGEKSNDNAQEQDPPEG